MDEKINSNPQIDMAVEDVTADREVIVDKDVAIIGVVCNCKKLNIRKEPDTDSEVIATIPIGTEVEIDPDKLFEIDDWFYVCTSAGIEGYCMAEYIETP